MLEDDTLEGRQPRRVQVLDNLHDRRRVESVEARIAVDEGPVQQLDACTRRLVHLLQSQTTRGGLERTYRYVNAGHLLERRILQKRLHELTLATPQIEHALGAGAREYCRHVCDPLFVQTQRFLDDGFLRGMGYLRCIWIELLIRAETGERLTRQMTLPA